MKKFLAVAMAALVFCALFSGCKSTGKNNVTTTTTTTETQTTIPESTSAEETSAPGTTSTTSTSTAGTTKASGKTTKKAATNTTSKAAAEKKGLSGSSKSVLDQIIAKAKTLDTDKKYGIKTLKCTDVAVDSDSCTDILGLSTKEFKNQVESATESKPNDSWQTHSVVVVKVKNGVNVATLAKKIIKNTKPDRFGCLKPDAILGGYAGQYIVFAASSESTCKAVFNAFSALSPISPTKLTRTNNWNTSLES